MDGQTPTAWINGSLVPWSEARISIFDAGVQHAIGLFETLTAREGRVVDGAAHVERLITSARELSLSDRLRADPLVEAVQLVVDRNDMTEARIRLTVTGGDLGPQPPGADRGRVDPTIIIVAQPPTPYPEAFFERGVRVVVADGRRNPLDPMGGHKTLNYWPNIHALQVAATRQAGEALWFTVSNHLCGGSVSNIVLVKGEKLRTPIARGEEASGALRMPVLPGITRGRIMEHAPARGLAVETAMLDIEAVLEADEVFLTNSSWGVLPVVGLEAETIGSGEPGPVTRTLRDDWLRGFDASRDAD